MPAPRTATSPSIWTMSTTRAASDLGVMSPKPTVEKTVTREVQGVGAGQRLGEGRRGGSFHQEVRRGEQQQEEGNDQTQRLDCLHTRVARANDFCDLPHHDAREDQQAEQQTDRRVGTQRPVQRKQVVQNHQHRREQETAQHRPDNEAPSLCPRQFLVGITGHIHPPAAEYVRQR